MTNATANFVGSSATPTTTVSNTSIVPGISDANELNDEVDSNELETDAAGAQHPTADQEADYKNLTFQGVPNSAVQKPVEGHQGRQSREEGTRDDDDAQLHWLRKMNPQESFNGWKKEFGQAFKKISKLTAKRNGPVRTGTNKNLKTQQQATTDEDAFTQDLAADLIDTLLAGCPAALFAGSSFLKDEHGVRRAPLLLAMLGVKVTPLTSHAPLVHANSRTRRRGSASSSLSSLMSDIVEEGYTSKFKLELEYGVGDNRLKWVVIKSYKDLVSLHSKLKLVSFQQNTLNKLYIDHNRFQRIHLPHFPRFDDHLKKQKEKNITTSAPAGIATDPTSSATTPRSSLQFEIKNFHMKHLQDLLDEQDDSPQPMHLRIERYLKLLNLALSLRPQANRLFQFYELSPIGNLLSYENGFQGKQGYMVIRSTAKTQGWRVSHFKYHDFRAMIERHTNKWFLIRHSYIIYVSDLYSTTPLDVFLVDSSFKIRYSGNSDTALKEGAKFDPLEDHSRKISTKLLITLENGERKLQIIAKSEYLLKLWVSSISKMAESTPWSKKHRFESFAPVRSNCFCKFLVDGRDYFWALSEALSMAKDVIFIHDWWLSPELYMRRPVKGNQGFRIDRILKERAESGVKVFIVVYRNVGSTVGTDSLWTKHSMLSLHPNIHVIRSPNQWLQNTYFWAHHEKMTVIDHTIAFMGGIDLCYGRYDTPEHVLRDDKPNLQDQNFPGKDYSNARICDFYDLDKPFESMYDRTVIPRMPWHDVHMVTVGEAARDMSRHFVQRWNYLLRQKRPSRPTPLLTPPSDFTEDELSESSFFQTLNCRSSCEVQVLRSAGNWSLGLKNTERSIHNAYLKLIETSEHYIYIENQFFVTSSSWDGVVIENKIGDALVDRIIKANSESKPWKAFIVIPLMPGFDSQVDQPEGSSVRVIMQCQYQSISRGDTSIFAKLKKLNIDPLQYIQFFSLRKWSTIGPYEKLVTEQLYVHAKVMIVDDRSCIIGSANVNERSMAGSRDSEVAAIIRDTDLVKTKMNGEEYLAGRFAWELRQRLMREHLGCDVDLVEIVERKFVRLQQIAILNYKTLHLLTGDSTDENKMINSAMVEVGYREVMSKNCSDLWMKCHDSKPNNFGIDHSLEDMDGGLPDPLNHKHNKKKAELPTKQSKKSCYTPRSQYHSFNNRAGEANMGIRDKKPISTDSRLVNNEVHLREVSGLGPDGWKKVTKKFKENVTEQLRSWATNMLTTKTIDGKRDDNVSLILPDREDVALYLHDTEITDESKWDMLKRICYLQHLAFKKNIKINNDHAQSKSDSSAPVPSKGRDRKKSFSGESLSSHETHSQILEEQELDDESIDEMLSQILPPIGGRLGKGKPFLNMKFIDPYAFDDPLADSFYEDMWFSVALRNTLLFRLVFHCQPDNAVQSWKEFKDFKRMAQDFDESQDKLIALEKSDCSTEADVPTSDEMGIQPDSTARLEKGNQLRDVPVNEMYQNSDVPVVAEGLRNGASAGHHRSQERKSKSSALKMKLSSSLLYGFTQKIFDKHTAQRLLERVHGHLVIFPTDWLAKEVESKNWFYNADRLPPIDIYD